jgi:hypothetical protein
MFGLGWLAVIVGFAAVWGVSRQLGLPTWWLGPRAQPQPWFLSLVPFALPVIVIAGTTTRARWLPWLGLAAAALLALVAAGDLGSFKSIAVVQFALAGAAGLISIAAWSGMYRALPNSPTSIGTNASTSAEPREAHPRDIG